MHAKPRNDAELAEYFGTNIEFGAAVDDIVFSSTIKRLPIVSADPYLNNLLTSHCEDALAHRRRNPGSFRSSVENAIVPLLPHGKARAGEIARQLGMSQRTFARRLSSEGPTFSELLERLRSDLANRYLADGMPISQVAWLLGYRDIGAFSHAFKRWTGRAPSRARSQATV
jgi:AraC-like DNA-binding protein